MSNSPLQINAPISNSWTPTIKGRSTEGTASYNRRHGTYFLIGKLCIASCEVNWSNGTGTGAICVSAPFTAKTHGEYSCFLGSASVLYIDWETQNTPTMCKIEGLEDYFTIVANMKNEWDQALLYAMTGIIRLSIMYEIE